MKERRSQVIREAKYKLNTNKYLIRAINFEANIDSIAAQIGDIFYFQHEVPNYREDEHSSRIRSAWNSGGKGHVNTEQDVILKANTTYKIL